MPVKCFEINLSKIELPQNVRQYFFGRFVLNYVDWVQLHKKMWKALCFKRALTKIFEIFDFLHFFQNKVKILFLVKFELKFGNKIKN
jgi:hypothetical protein